MKAPIIEGCDMKEIRLEQLLVKAKFIGCRKLPRLFQLFLFKISPRLYFIHTSYVGISKQLWIYKEQFVIPYGCGQSRVQNKLTSSYEEIIAEISSLLVGIGHWLGITCWIQNLMVNIVEIMNVNLTSSAGWFCH